MESILRWINTTVAPPLYRVTQNRWIESTLTGFQKNMTLIIVGALLQIVSRIAAVVTHDPNNIWGVMTNLTFGLLAVFIAIGIATSMAKHHGIPDFTPGILAVCVFFILNKPTFTPDGSLQIATMRLGAVGLFLAIVAGLVTGEVMGQFLKRKWTFRVEGLPDFVGSWFTPIIPAAILVVAAWVVAYPLNIDLFTLIARIISPLMTASDTFLGFWLTCFILTALFAVGINGAVTFGVLIPLWMAAVGENAALVQQGLPPAHINTLQTLVGWVVLGGTGATLTLNLLMLWSRSRSLKTLGRASILPSLLNINEPLIFGLPIAFNPILAIPFILNGGIINPMLVYLAMNAGLVSKPFIPLLIPWLPPGISGFIFNQDLRGVVLVLILLALNVLVWYPFFKVTEGQMLAKEIQEAPAEKTAATLAHSRSA